MPHRTLTKEEIAEIAKTAGVPLTLTKEEIAEIALYLPYEAKFVLDKLRGKEDCNNEAIEEIIEKKDQ